MAAVFVGLFIAVVFGTLGYLIGRSERQRKAVVDYSNEATPLYDEMMMRYPHVYLSMKLPITATIAKEGK